MGYINTITVCKGLKTHHKPPLEMHLRHSKGSARCTFINFNTFQLANSICLLQGVIVSNGLENSCTSKSIQYNRLSASKSGDLQRQSWAQDCTRDTNRLPQIINLVDSQCL